ncbi:MAG: HdeD family acid-resistance protein [Bradyrhizobium sp.]|uniref:HdeD family acid-resistance protein n=1 Tax=Bradyrhizobium sp. TaxID=376 RepID=UPI0025C4663B|nr:HdeD family acid-resistance protein [Bradyrhizobium sp.]MBI5261943.1 HdeD family acid-resistance protein [Bradyrhizobium sp.]
MTNASDVSQNLQAGSNVAPLRAKWGWIVALGVVYIFGGTIALGSMFLATVASVLMVGVMMIIAGVAEVINAFQMKSWGKFLIWALLGVLYVVAGFVTFQNPLFAAVLLTLLLGASLVVSGILRIFLALSMKRGTFWGWVALSGVITLLLGILILARWPINSVYILGLFLGIDLIIAGAGWVGVGFSLRRGQSSSTAQAPAT